MSPATREDSRAATWLCVMAVVAGLALRVLYLAEPWRVDLSEHPVFVADEGVVGLMARHILEGARPLFYYGQHYMGAIEAYIAAPIFALFGSSMTTLRMAPAISSTLWIPLTYLLARRLTTRGAALLAAALMALPTLFVFQWGFKARGGYAEMVALVLVMAVMLLDLLSACDRVRLAVLGFAAGLALWVNQLAGAYVVAAAAVLFFWVPMDRRRWSVVLVSGAIGLSPLIYANIVEPLATVRALAGEVKWAAVVGKSYRETTERTQPLAYRSVPLLQVVGAQPRRDATFSAPGVIVALGLLGGAVGAAGLAIRRRREDPLLSQRLGVIGAFVATSVVLGVPGLAGHPVGRYQLVLYPLLAALLVTALEAWRPRFTLVVVGVLCFFNAGRLVSPGYTQERTERADVIALLRGHDLHFGYSAGYMQDLVLDASETIVLVPVSRARYAPYEAIVTAAERPFYLFRRSQESKASHQAFVGHLEQREAGYREDGVGEYRVWYDFTPLGVLDAGSLGEIRAEEQRLKGR